ncbi:MAG TPA: hypothetical protein VKX16_07410 [Chloroflexota bacterium]|nr:hypothetical protein [Chloroflexota bacterium]
MVIGTVVKSNSHISYLCRVFGRLEVDPAPRPQEYAFGTFVTLAPVDDSPVRLVGVVRDTLLINPEYGNFGPRLSSEPELEVFSPDYLDEKGVLVDVLILGWLDRGQARHGVPAVAAQVGTRVEGMVEDAVRDFHRDARGRFLMGYLPPLLTRNDAVIAGLLLGVLERLEPAFPDQQRVIGVLKNNLAWKSRVVPAG